MEIIGILIGFFLVAKVFPAIIVEIFDLIDPHVTIMPEVEVNMINRYIDENNVYHYGPFHPYNPDNDRMYSYPYGSKCRINSRYNWTSGYWQQYLTNYNEKIHSGVEKVLLIEDGIASDGKPTYKIVEYYYDIIYSSAPDSHIKWSNMICKKYPWSQIDYDEICRNALMKPTKGRKIFK